MKLGSLVAAVWSITGLVLLWTHMHEVWAIFGLFFPPIPMVYTVFYVLGHMGCL